uniref:HDC09215 n=1 Tax=Drosophila melanogaster TaxID=7227 RepID=Q6ILK4_DROME|nr:TPA_inf: HDC09215 [Drosophila melanogaster]
MHQTDGRTNRQRLPDRDSGRLTFATVEFNVQRYNDRNILFFNPTDCSRCFSSANAGSASDCDCGRGHPCFFHFQTT